LFTETADLYDLVYSFKDHPDEVARLRGMAGREGEISGVQVVQVSVTPSGR
jgi:hypothetical protein